MITVYACARKVGTDEFLHLAANFKRTKEIMAGRREIIVNINWERRDGWIGWKLTGETK